jgi:hypothetical protein
MKDQDEEAPGPPISLFKIAIETQEVVNQEYLRIRGAIE